jgi:hypothetical protein
VQLAIPTKSGGQESNEITKSPLFAPVIPTLLISSIAPLLLVRVTDWGELVVPTACGGKSMLVRERVTTVPVPLRDTVCGLAPPLSKKLRVALSGPMTEGRNVTFTVQVPFPAKLLPQVCEALTKSFALVPVIVIPVKFNILAL